VPDWSQISSVMMVCHGNICRSPMAECVLAHLLKEAGLDGIAVASSATSTEELGNPIHPGALAELRRHGVPIRSHRAVQLRRDDLAGYDLFLGMDSRNLVNMRRILGEESCPRCFRLLDFSGRARDIADPWYSGDFRETWDDILEGCQAIVAELRQAGKKREAYS